MSCQGHGQSCFVSRIPAQFRQTSVKRWFSTSESDTEATICVKFIEPTSYLLKIKYRWMLRREAVRARKITGIRQCD
jgi:hypothetical protein